eukprot:270656-Prymnesium_polylepis.1
MAHSGGTDVGVGCSKFSRKPFRGLPGEDRMSGLHCAGTHGLERWPSTRIISRTFTAAGGNSLWRMNQSGSCIRPGAI